MEPSEQIGRGWDSSEPAAERLEDLIAIAVVIAAGCERCAKRMVERALRHGGARPLVQRTLGIVAHLRSRDCFVQAVGPEVIARMKKPLEAGRRALRNADPPTEDWKCGELCRPVEDAGATIGRNPLRRKARERKSIV